MLDKASTPPGANNQGVHKTRLCCVCGQTFQFVSRTVKPKFCDACRVARVRERARVGAERARRKRGIPALKGTKATCVRCGQVFIKTNIKHVYCASCGTANYVERTRQASRARHATQEGRDYTNKWIRDKRRSDPSWRVSGSMRVLIHRALKRNKQGKSWRTFVDYSLSELMAHLEKKFLPGMTWDNYGRWHIDHITPRKAFVFKGPNDPGFKAAWVLENLQPLWALDNIRKNAKIGAGR